MSRSVPVAQLGAAINEELRVYGEDVNRAIAEITTESMKELVKKTKANAPIGARKSFKKNITADYSKLKGSANKFRNFSATWYVKAPDYRLTHLLVHGHEKKNGGRTRANPFLSNAVDEVVPDYERKLEEAIRNGG